MSTKMNSADTKTAASEPGRKPGPELAELLASSQPIVARLVGDSERFAEFYRGRPGHNSTLEALAQARECESQFRGIKTVKDFERWAEEWDFESLKRDLSR